MAVDNLSNLVSDFDKMQKYYEDLYSRPLYMNPNNPNTVMNVNDGMQSPQTLAPHGSNARVVNPSSTQSSVEKRDYQPLDLYTDQTALANFSKMNEAFSSPSTLAPHGSNARVVEPSSSQPGSSQPVEAHNIEMKPLDVLSDAEEVHIRTSAELEKEFGGEESGGEKGGKKIDGKELANGITAVAGFAGEAYSSFKGTDASKGESWGKTGKMTLSGAATGAQIGGPWGAAIGAVVGFGAGMINMGADTRKRNNEKRDRLQKSAREFDQKTKDAYEIENAERELELLKSFSNSQLNYLK